MISRMKRSRAGFTLVELIVVIAILAILAGVAIPVYSNYVNKANEASDLQLLGAVNTAFAAACAGRGIDPTRIYAAPQALVDGCLKGIAAPTELNEDFLTFFGDNVNTPFKVYTSLAYDRTNGVFVDGAREYTFTTAYGTVTVTAAQLGAYRGSSFDQMGAAGITSRIDALVNQAMGSITEGSGQQLFNSTDFQSFLTEKGITLDPSDPEYDKKAANALVLYTASHAGDADVQAWLSGLESGGVLPSPTADTSGMMLSVSAEYAMLAAYCSDQSALITTVGEEQHYTAPKSTIPQLYNEDGSLDTDRTNEYVRSTYGENATWVKTRKGLSITVPGEETVVNANEWFTQQTQNMTSMFDITGLHGAVNSTTGEPIEITGMWEIFSQSNEFQSYVQNQAGADLNAFLNALQMVDANTGNVDINSVLTDGWEHGGVADIIAAVTGNP